MHCNLSFRVKRLLDYLLKGSAISQNMLLHQLYHPGGNEGPRHGEFRRPSRLVRRVARRALAGVLEAGARSAPIAGEEHAAVMLAMVSRSGEVKTTGDEARARFSARWKGNLS